MLGHDVPFSYCRTCRENFPCRKIFDCWFERFDIVSFMQEHFTEEELERITAPPEDKRVSLFELIKKAQERKGEE